MYIEKTSIKRMLYDSSMRGSYGT